MARAMPLRCAPLLALLALAGVHAPSAPVAAQVTPEVARVPIESIAVEGNLRMTRDEVLALVPFEAGDEVTQREVREMAKVLMGTGQFRDVRVRALGPTGVTGDPVTLVVEVDEQPFVREVRFLGLENADGGTVRDSAGLAPGQPYSPQAMAEARALIREELASKGIPFASIDERLVPVPRDTTNVVDLIIEVEEGNRVTVAGLEVVGNDAVATSTIAGAMQTRPEGFWWFLPGTYERSSFEADLDRNIPGVYHDRGYLDFEILSDTLVVDPESGKARLRIEVYEGEQYRIARLNVDGNNALSDEEIDGFFRPEEGGLLQSLGIGGAPEDVERRGQIFDRGDFQASLQRLREAYANRGYIWTNISETVQKTTTDGAPAVDLRVQIQEGPLAIVNEVNIQGNDYTHEWVIRDKLFVVPGDVFSQQRLLQSYQNIQSLGFFQTPLPPPNVDPRPEEGEVDITFVVEEQQTGSVNFGSSVGGGVGVSGFIGYDQPNLFGQAKEAHVRWDFGRFVNNFTVSFSDPALFRSRISGTISLFNARDRFFQFDSGERRRIGGSLRFGFPIPNAPRARFFAGYALSRTDFELASGTTDESLFGRSNGTQSQLSLSVLRSTLNHPLFPTQGSSQEFTTELNGGFLGGDGEFQKVTTQARWWLPVGQLGGGASPITLATGMILRGGAIFGDPSRFPFDRFTMGGVQFNERLRGYEETEITPDGFFPENSTDVADASRFGDAFLSMSAETALRLNDAFSLSAFFDAGNVWENPNQIDPSRLFKGAGFGVDIVSPFGPIGIDYAYGFDKTTPGWVLHFNLGQGF